MISNHDDESELESHREKRRMIDNSASTSTSSTAAAQFRWRTAVEQENYSSNLIAALRRVRNRNGEVSTVSGSRAVREAADKALATTAKGRSRWSRAILNNRLKLRIRKYRKAKTRSKFVPIVSSEKVTAPVDKRVKVLSRLVPGCRKLSFPNLLEETSDYISALQMQVRAMTALEEILSGSSSLSGSFLFSGGLSSSSSTGWINAEMFSSSSNDSDYPVD